MLYTLDLEHNSTIRRFRLIASCPGGPPLPRPGTEC